MGSGGGVGEVPTIFHPRRSLGPSIVFSEEQQNHGPYTTSAQVLLDSSGIEIFLIIFINQFFFILLYYSCLFS